MKDSDGKSVYFVSENEVGLHFQIEHYARSGVDEPDLEIVFDMDPSTLEQLFTKYAVKSEGGLLEKIQALSNAGHSERFRQDIWNEVFPIQNKFSWMSW
jgi:hypothetical protein